MNSPVILFEDSHYLGVVKPCGWPTQKTLDSKRQNLEAWVEAHGHPNSSAAHRLDVETSGIVLFAKTREARQVLDKLFKDKKIHKTYVGICYGKPLVTEGEWSNFVKEGKKEKVIITMPVEKGGDLATTGFSLIKAHETLSLMYFYPHTGRMHQIRMHAAHNQLPLVGDELYGPFKKNQGAMTSRHWLHAMALEFEDPLSGKKIKIETGIPSEFLSVFEKGCLYQYILLNKPYDVLCQFSGEEKDKTLADFALPKDVWPVGRLDKNSEGAVLLTNDKNWRHFIMSPESGKQKIYWAQVEGEFTEEEMRKMNKGINIGDHLTRPSWSFKLENNFVADLLPLIGPEGPKIRQRKNQATSWIEIILEEGKNHQVRKMTAAMGHPTLRLIRVGYGKYKMKNLLPGKWKLLDISEIISIGMKAHS